MFNVPKVAGRPMPAILRVPRRPWVAGPRTVVGQTAHRRGRIKTRPDGFARGKTPQRGFIAIVPFADHARAITALLQRLAQERVMAATVAAASPKVTARVH